MGGSTSDQVFDVMFYFLYGITIVIGVVGAILVARILRGTGRKLGVAAFALVTVVTLSGLIRSLVYKAVIRDTSFNFALMDLWDMLNFIGRMAVFVVFGLALLATGRNLAALFNGSGATASAQRPQASVAAAGPQQQPVAPQYGATHPQQNYQPQGTAYGTTATNYLPQPGGPQGQPSAPPPYPQQGYPQGQPPNPQQGAQPRWN